MKYSEMLSDAIKKSGLKYLQIVARLEKQGVKVSKSYISKLCNGKEVGTERMNAALVSALEAKADISLEELRLAAYKEKFPTVVEALEGQQQQSEHHGGI